MTLPLSCKCRASGRDFPTTAWHGPEAALGPDALSTSYYLDWFWRGRLRAAPPFRRPSPLGLATFRERRKRHRSNLHILNL